MSDLWINWRIAYWHLQIGPGFPWCVFLFNRYRWDEGNKNPLIDFIHTPDRVKWAMIAAGSAYVVWLIWK